MQCNNCGTGVQPTKKFSWFWFIILLLAFGVPGFIYLIYYWTKSKNICPNCNKNLYK